METIDIGVAADTSLISFIANEDNSKLLVHYSNPVDTKEYVKVYNISDLTGGPLETYQVPNGFKLLKGYKDESLIIGAENQYLSIHDYMTKSLLWKDSQFSEEI